MRLKLLYLIVFASVTCLSQPCTQYDYVSESVSTNHNGEVYTSYYSYKPCSFHIQFRIDSLDFNTNPNYSDSSNVLEYFKTSIDKIFDQNILQLPTQTQISYKLILNSTWQKTGKIFTSIEINEYCEIDYNANYTSTNNCNYQQIDFEKDNLGTSASNYQFCNAFDLVCNNNDYALNIDTTICDKYGEISVCVDNAFNVVWSPSNLLEYNNLNCVSLSLNGLDSIEYIAMLSKENCDFVIYDTVKIKYHNPEITNLVSDQTILKGDCLSLDFTQYPNYSFEFFDYQSIDNSNPGAPLLCPQRSETFNLSYQNQEGCEASKSFTLEVYDPVQHYDYSLLTKDQGDIFQVSIDRSSAIMRLVSYITHGQFSSSSFGMGADIQDIEISNGSIYTIKNDLLVKYNMSFNIMNSYSLSNYNSLVSIEKRGNDSLLIYDYISGDIIYFNINTSSYNTLNNIKKQLGGIEVTSSNIFAWDADSIYNYNLSFNILNTFKNDGSVNQMELDSLANLYVLSGGNNLKKYESGVYDKSISMQGINFNPKSIIVEYPSSNNLLYITQLDDTLRTLNLSELENPILKYPTDTLASKYNINFSTISDKRSTKNTYQISNYSNFSNIVLSNTFTSSFMIDSLNYNTTYYWRAKSENNFANTGYGNADTFQILGLNPPTFTSPSLGSSVSGNSPEYVWDDGYGTFELQVSTVSNFEDYESYLIFNSSTFDGSVLEYSKQHYARIRKIDRNEVGAWSLPINFSTGVPIVPYNLLPNNGLTEIDESNVFSWDAGSCKSFIIQISEDMSFGDILLSKYLESDSIVGLNFNNQEILYWRVKSSYDEISSAWSSVRNFKPKYKTPEIVGLKSINESLLPLFFWQDTTDIYEAEIIDLDNQITIFNMEVGNVNNFSGVLLEYDTQYNFRLRAKREVSPGVYECAGWNEETFTTLDTSSKFKNNFNTIYVNSELNYTFNYGIGGSFNFLPNYYNSEPISSTNNQYILTKGTEKQLGVVIDQGTVSFDHDLKMTFYAKFSISDLTGNDQNYGKGLALELIPKTTHSEIPVMDFDDFWSLMPTPSNNKLILEIDTYNDYFVWNNANYEPNITGSGGDVDHISLYINNMTIPVSGNMTGDYHNKSTFVNAKDNERNIEDGLYHCIEIIWEAPNNMTTGIGKFKIYFDGDLRNEYNISAAQRNYFLNSNYESRWLISGFTDNSSLNYQEIKLDPKKTWIKTN